MKAFTIWQPWASLIMVGAKPYEFRPKSYLQYINPPAIGERVVVHAGARPIRPREVYELLAQCRAGGAHTGLIVEKAIPLLERIAEAHKCRGVVEEGFGLGTVIIGEPRNAGVIFGGLPHDSDRGDFNWAWPMQDPRPFDAPIPMRGSQGFWAWPERRAA